MSKFTPLLGAFLSITLSSLAQACPLCHSSTADEVRAGIAATAQDGSVFFALFGPFIILSVVLGILNRLMPDPYTAANEEGKV